MLKKIQTALLISCLSTSSYAYLVQTNFTVENKTKTSMMITVTGGNGEKISKPISSDETIIIDKNKLYKDFGGWPSGTATAVFEIRSDDASSKLYVQGQIFYGIYSAFWEEYSFLDSVSYAKGLDVDSSYSCWPQWRDAFENTIVIKGIPGERMERKELSANVQHCKGLKSSILSEDHRKYTPLCSNSRTDDFDLNFEIHDYHGSLYRYYNPDRDVVAMESSDMLLDNAKIKEGLDNTLNNKARSDDGFKGFCGSW